MQEAARIAFEKEREITYLQLAQEAELEALAQDSRDELSQARAQWAHKLQLADERANKLAQEKDAQIGHLLSLAGASAHRSVMAANAIDSLQEQLTSAREETAGVEMRNDALKMQIQEVAWSTSTTLEVSAAELAQAQESADYLRAEAGRAFMLLAEAEEKAAVLGGRALAAETRLSASITLMQQLESAARAAEERYAAKLSALEGSLSDAEARLAEAAARVAASEGAAARAQAMVEALGIAAEAATQRSSDTVSALRASLKAAEEQSADANAMLEGALTVRGKAFERIRTLQQSLTDSQSAAADSRATAGRAQSRAEALALEIEAARASAAVSAEQSADSEAKLNGALAVRNLAFERIRSLQQSLAEAKASAAAARADAEAAAQSAAAAQADSESLSKELEAAKAAAVSAEAQSADTQSKLDGAMQLILSRISMYCA